MKKLLFFIFLTAAARLCATHYYVTQGGSTTPLSTNNGSPSSVATYNASSLPTGGDTVHFTGTITSTIIPNTSGTGNGAGRLILDFSGATLNTASPRINGNGKNYITYDGGGSWGLGTGVYTSGCIVGAIADGTNFFTFNNQTSTDCTIQGFQAILNDDTSAAGFIYGDWCPNILIAHNNVVSMTNFYFSDKSTNHDITISSNFFSSNHCTTTQADIVAIGDAPDVTFDGNKFIHYTPGSDLNSRHNDIIQSYRNGGSLPAYPTRWIMRYNWLQSANAVAGSNGNSSVTQMEYMDGSAALKVYGNVFKGINGTTATNGFDVYNGQTPSIFWYNNTFITSGGAPGNATVFTTGTLYNQNSIYADDTSTYGGTSVLWTSTEGGGASGWNNNIFYRWGTQTNAAGPNGTDSVDPLLTNLAGGDYSLQSGSPAKWTGNDTIGAEYDQGIKPGTNWPNPEKIPRTSSHWSKGAYEVAFGGDTTAPTPNPATISGTPTHTSTTISVTATTATDETSLGTTPYRFSNDNGSSWTAYQLSASYTWTGLTPSTLYNVKVQYQDAALNAGTASTASAVTTDAAPTAAPKGGNLKYSRGQTHH